ncbi:CRISPR-associated protein [Dehalococcoides mccartyi]|uniref:CRISPR-associated protein n=1 Tax=Dehalococcoides mccartyi TaxID=61435 RepID=A0A0V8M570_9CHLR|nr:CRISPR-associated helicase/endonuclease Cas3 [Dehalococcoides mccartyi]KSV18903.1 CRISPR-associated protein [Dehalococcoides mccartyi]
MKESSKYIARYNPETERYQYVADHLLEVAIICSGFSSKIGLKNCGYVTGLLHDLGKYSAEFQKYIRINTGLRRVASSHTDFSCPKPDHSSAGGQYIRKALISGDTQAEIVAQAIAIAVFSHHTGLPDCIGLDGTDNLIFRFKKEDLKTHLSEVSGKMESQVKEKLNSHLQSEVYKQEFGQLVEAVQSLKESSCVSNIHLGLALRFLFSALIDADRLNAAGRKPLLKQIWNAQVKNLEDYLLTFKTDTPLNLIRQQVSDTCLKRSPEKPGLYKLSVPTGGGKTLSSLRFALHHAHKHSLERIFYIAPYTTILDQNATVIRQVLNVQAENPLILEHHSNILEDTGNPVNEQLAENWEAPIVLTTSVQFLETFYSNKTGCTRRLHNLAKSVVIFDEVQALPDEMIYLFNNAVNFLTRMCDSTVLLCTATQPPLDKVDDMKGTIYFSASAELAPNPNELYLKLNKRVKVENRCKDGGHTNEEVQNVIREQATQSKKILVVVNTKTQARELYASLKIEFANIYHLSTSMCPCHRRETLSKLKEKLESVEPSSRPLVCISTQLIEAGVDIDFEVVVRYLAGMDSITQSAGRCNRHFRQEQGLVILLNPAGETLKHLQDIETGKFITNRVLTEFATCPGTYQNHLLHPELLARYYHYYFFKQKNKMDYQEKINGISESILNMYSNQHNGVAAYNRINKEPPKLYFSQAFKTAGDYFKVIDNSAKGIIANCNSEAENIITRLCASQNITELNLLLKKAQQYSVNLFEYEFEKLAELKGLHETQPESGIFYLDKNFYNSETGVSAEPNQSAFTFF